MIDEGKKIDRILQISGVSPNRIGDGRTATLETVRAIRRTGVELFYAYPDDANTLGVTAAHADATQSLEIPLKKQCDGKHFVSKLITRISTLWQLLKCESHATLRKRLHLSASAVRAFSLAQPSPFSIAATRLAESMQFDLIQVDYTWMVNLATQLPKSIPKVFVVHELQALIVEQTHPNAIKLNQFIRRLEKAALAQYDAVIALCADDAAFIKSVYQLEHVTVSPLAVAVDNQRVPSPTLCHPPVFSFLGGFAHSPNVDALLWLRDEIAPKILYLLPDAQFRIIGNYPDSFTSEFKSNFVFTGYVNNVESELSGTTFICPLRIGSGMRIKILDAIVAGAPVISTSIGARGLGLTDGKSIAICNSTSGFADAAVNLANDHETSALLARNAWLHVSSTYAPQVVGPHRLAVLREIAEKFNAKTRKPT